MIPAIATMDRPIISVCICQGYCPEITVQKQIAAMNVNLVAIQGMLLHHSTIKFLLLMVLHLHPVGVQVALLPYLHFQEAVSTRLILEQDFIEAMNMDIIGSHTIVTGDPGTIRDMLFITETQTWYGKELIE